MMYTRFVFGKTGDKRCKDQEVHPYGLFLDPLSPVDGNLSELKWKTNLKIDQARLISKNKDATVNTTFMYIYTTVTISYLFPRDDNKISLKDM